MKLRTSIWTVVIIICIGLGLWRRDDLGVVWREYSSLYKHIEYKDYSVTIRGPFISPKVAKEDPEAAAVAETQLAMWNCENEERVEQVTEQFLKQPDNEFVLFELIKSFWYLRDNTIDLQIVLKLTDKLIALDPNNANYHYIKSYLLLADRKDNAVDAAIQETERANKCSKYDFPYKDYEQRVTNIADKAKLGWFLKRRLFYTDNRNPFTYDIREKLTAQANIEFTEGDTAKGMRITDAITKMQKSQLLGGDQSARLGAFMWAYSFGHWDEPHGLELQRADLDTERARKNRLELSALAESRTIVDDESKEKQKENRKKEHEILTCTIYTYPAAHVGRMFIAFSSACAILLLVSLLCGFREKTKIGFSGIFLFVLSCAYYFCIVNANFLASLVDHICLCQFSYIDAFIYNFLSLGSIIEEEPFLTGLFLAGPILAALLLWGLGFLRPRKGAFWKFWYVRVFAALIIGGGAAYIVMRCQDPNYSDWWKNCAITGGFFAILAWVVITFAWWLFRCRIVRLFLAITFLGTITLLTSGYRYINYLPIIVFVLITTIIVVVNPNKGSALKTTLRIFSRKSDVSAVRNKCLRLATPFIAGYWVILILLTPIVAKCIKLEREEFDVVDYRLIVPEPNKAYQQLMSKLEAEEFYKQDIYRLLPLTMPEDLPGVLQKLKEKEFKDHYFGSFLSWSRNEISEEDKIKQEQMRQRATRLNDDDLVKVMRGCGRDVVDIITSFLEKPDAEQALAARARLGDSSVKEKLETLLQIRIQNEPNFNENEKTRTWKWYVDKPLRASEIVSALACVSEPNEAREQFLNYIENREVDKLTYDNEFFDGLILLPRSDAQKVIKAYLTKAKNYQPESYKTSFDDFYVNPYRTVQPLRRLVGCYGDRQIAEDIFKTILSAVDQEEEFESFDISPYFQLQSAEILKKGLTSKNADMRAWSVWQLRKIDYQWNSEELEKLLTDKSWKVRANAVIAGGKQSVAAAPKDRNSFVRLVASFSNEN